MGKKKLKKPPEMLVPLFQCARIIFFNSKKYAAEYIEAEFGECFTFEGMDGFEWQCEKKGRIYLMIGVFNGSIPVLAHEAAHACFDICKIAEIPTPNDQQNETFCYLITRIMEKFIPYLSSN